MANKLPVSRMVKIEKIDFDVRDYDVTFDEISEGNLEILTDSTERLGILNPIRLIDNGDIFIIISGRKRVTAAKNAGMSEVPAFVYDNSITDRYAMTLGLIDNFPEREYTAVEASWIIHRLVRNFGVDDDEIIRDFFPLLRLTPSKKILVELLSIYELTGEIKILAHHRRYSRKILVRWLDFAADDRRQITKLISSAHFGSGAAMEILKLLSELTIRDEASVEVILENDRIKAIMNDKNLSQNEKGEKLRGAIKRLRYPMLDELERKFNKWAEDLNIPRGAKISHTPYFEGEMLEFSINFRDTKGLKEMGEFLIEASEREEMSKLLEMI